MKTLEDALKDTLGNLLFQLVVLQNKVELLSQALSELEKKLEPPKEG